VNEGKQLAAMTASPCIATANLGIINDICPARRYPGAMSVSAHFAAFPHVKRAANAARAVLGAALDLALPQLCPSCREPVDDSGLCPSCWSKLSFIARPYCERLGIPFAYDPGPGILSMEAIADPPAYNRARAAVRFEDISRALVHSFKYGDRLDLAPMMGRWMSRAGRELLVEADALVPVPLHWRRQWARRFNQSAMLADAISAESGVPIAAGALKRVKATAQQVGLTRLERASNVQGAFKVPEESKAAVVGRRLVLVDDVLTSGATVDGCARVLNRAGAANVDVLIFARVADPVRTSI
jgi:ComF family protein